MTSGVLQDVPELRLCHLCPGGASHPSHRLCPDGETHKAGERERENSQDGAINWTGGFMHVCRSTMYNVINCRQCVQRLVKTYF